jgi:hypothetical protein
MNRWYLLAGATILCAISLAQIVFAQYQTPSGSSQPYQPVVPEPSTITAYGGYPGNVGGTTAAGSAMSGMANAISAKGNYNLATSAAAVNMTQAQKNEIENHQQYENTYFQMKETNQAYQKAHAGTRMTQEQLARWAREAAPQPLSPKEVNSVTGKVDWPDILQEDTFASQRGQLEQLLTKKASHGSLSFSDQTDARKTIEIMFAELKSQIKDVPPQEYLDSRKFLRSLIYATSQSDL